MKKTKLMGTKKFDKVTSELFNKFKEAFPDTSKHAYMLFAIEKSTHVMRSVASGTTVGEARQIINMILEKIRDTYRSTEA